LFLAAAAPASPALLAADTSDRIAIFDPPPSRIRIVIEPPPAPRYAPEEIQKIKSAGKNVEIMIPATVEEFNKVLPECDVLLG
jgi:hypothetical protein